MGIFGVVHAAAAERLLGRRSNSTYSDTGELPSALPSTNPAKWYPDGAPTNSTSLQRPQPVSYGSTSSRTRRDSVLDRVPEDSTVNFHERDDEQCDDDWGREVEATLESQGLYKGSYARELLRYSVVPLSTIIFFALAIVPPLVYRTQGHNSYPYTSYFPYPLPELVLPGTLWVLTYAVKSPIYAACATLAGLRELPQYAYALVATVLPILLHSALSIILRLFAISSLLIHDHAIYPEPDVLDPAMKRAWWAGVGWAAAESIVAMTLGYRAVSWYRDVLVNEKDVRRGGSDRAGFYLHGQDDEQRPASPDTGSSSLAGSPRMNAQEPGQLLRSSSDVTAPDAASARALTATLSEETLDELIEQDLDELITLRKREEIEEQYGMAFIRIPITIPILQRLNSLLFSIGSFLLISAATFSKVKAVGMFAFDPYRPAHVAFTIAKHGLGESSASLPLPPILVAVAIAHAAPTITSATLIGPHVAAYVGLLISLVVFFAGLGVWGALE
ncbi:hypothetical protein HDZ31DRAFT_65514 [Schizophyllum fasciatum]